jgi:NAD(P)-dependent dehydrogenase (short-subunit alcohol dehydrogenase family)
MMATPSSAPGATNGPQLTGSADVVAITGAANGIGRQIALEAVARAARVLWLIDRDEQALRALCDELSGRCDLRPRPLDVTSRTSLADLSAEWMRGDPPGVLVNNAGVRASTAPINDITDAEWDVAIATNLTAVFSLTRAASGAMRHRGIEGVIVNIASTASVVGFSNRAAYCASKAGVLGLTRGAALDLAPYGIRVVAVSPGFQQSGISDDLDDGIVTATVPLGRRGDPAELAALVFDIARSSYVTGANIVVDGGAVVGRPL